MNATYHFASAQDFNQDVFNAIKLAFKSKPFTIFVEEDSNDFELTADMKALLDERLNEDTNTYIPKDVVMNRIKLKYGL